MKYFFCILFFVAVSCKKDEVALTPTQQLANDIEVIDNYLAAHNIKNVVKDPSGLRYVIQTEGNGPVPDLSSYLKVNYAGAYLPSGAVFDFSAQPPGYFPFALDGLIDGWQIAFQILKQGTTATLYIPSGLGYGPQGNGSGIPPNSNLMFQVELIDFYDDGNVQDADGNLYSNTLTGNQLWLNTNLTVSTFANGETIDPLQWSNYDDNPTLGEQYGKLYSYVLVSDPRKLCPAGYKIPSKSDWDELAASMVTKATNIIHLLPGGNRESDGTYSGATVNGVYWASDVQAGGSALTLVYSPTGTTMTSSVVSSDIQASVRCIKGY